MTLSVLLSGFVASTLKEVEMLLKYGATTASDGVQDDHIAVANSIKEKLPSNYDNPFNDILYGIPISLSKIHRLADLLSVYRQEENFSRAVVHILIDHSSQIDFVEQFFDLAKIQKNQAFPLTSFSVFLKLDTGYHRAGISCDERGLELAMEILKSPFLVLKGFYSHCGQSYDVNTSNKREEIASSDVSTMMNFVRQFKKRAKNRNSSFLPSLSCSVGSTPSLFTALPHTFELQNLEIHPGNYTMYDRQQLWTGVCDDVSKVSGRVLSRVIGHYEDRNTILIDAGATALTKETTPQGGYGAIDGFPDLECFAMSQEVTRVRPKDQNARFPFEELPIGSMINILPNHSCLAAACFDQYYIIDDKSSKFSPNEIVVDEWKVWQGW